MNADRVHASSKNGLQLADLVRRVLRHTDKHASRSMVNLWILTQIRMMQVAKASAAILYESRPDRGQIIVADRDLPYVPHRAKNT